MPSMKTSGTARKALDELAAIFGVQRSYRDNFGRRQNASAEAVCGALRALGAELPADSSNIRALNAALRARRMEDARRIIDPVQVAWDGRLSHLNVRLSAASSFLSRGAKFRLTISQEDGTSSNILFSGSELHPNIHSSDPGCPSGYLPLTLQLPIGYHRLELEGTAGKRSFCIEATILSAPERCYSPPGKREKSWGAFLPLYALRAQKDWGTGNFAMLAQLHEWVLRMGGSWTGTLPVLASFLDRPFEPSPYMPVSRLFWNELYISPEQETEFAESAAARRIPDSANWRAQLAAIHRAPLVDYASAMRLKRPVLEAMAQQMSRQIERDTPRARQFGDFLAGHPDVSDYARFRAVQERRLTPWMTWPDRLRRGELTARDRDTESERYHQYVQWIADHQLAQIGAQSQRGGLYLDFPLGVHPDGYDVWRNQRLFVRAAAAGAPPDDLFPDGQNWGFPPLHPEAMREDGYAYLRACFNHQMRHAKMLRIDHVMGLNRLYWIPSGISTRDGVYVHYHSEELYAVLSLESHRARTIVVGENLGTVPETVNRAMQRHHARGIHIFQFSVSPGNGSPLRKPSGRNVASLNSHDTPPFAGFLRGRDIDDFERLGVFAPERAARRREFRRAVIAAIGKALEVRDPFRPAGERQLLERSLKWLAKSPAEMVLVNLEDLWQEILPQNIPGTGVGTVNPNEPNWRRKAALPLERIQRDPVIRRLLKRIMASRNATGRSAV